MENDNSGGSAAQNGQGTPAGSSKTELPPEVQQRLTELENQAKEGGKAKQDLAELQDYFQKRRELYDAALMYDRDPNFQKVIKDYVTRSHTSGVPESQKTTDLSGNGLDLSFLDADQRKALHQYIEQAIGSRLKPLDDTMSQLKGYVTQSQIDQLRGRYTKEAGFPFSFQEVENEIAAMINNGQAVSADGAYLQLVGSKYPTVRADLDKTIKEQKRQISMSRYTAPSNYPIKRSSEGPKTFLDAIKQASEQVGT